MAFQRILVAIDRVPIASLVFQRAIEQVQLLRRQSPDADVHFMVVHTVRQESDLQTNSFWHVGTIADIDLYGSLRRTQQERMQRELRRSEEWLLSFGQQAIAQGIVTETDCRMGEPAVRICELAVSWQADLIVLGRRGHQGLAEVMLGSVSNYVLHHAPCSVLVVQGAVPDLAQSASSESASIETAIAPDIIATSESALPRS